jgi:hypothetical protein
LRKSFNLLFRANMPSLEVAPAIIGTKSRFPDSSSWRGDAGRTISPTDALSMVGRNGNPKPIGFSCVY